MTEWALATECLDQMLLHKKVFKHKVLILRYIAFLIDQKFDFSMKEKSTIMPRVLESQAWVPVIQVVHREEMKY